MKHETGTSRVIRIESAYPVERITADFRAQYAGKNKNTDSGTAALKKFRRIILDYYRRSGRDFPWRRTLNPYHILVSEIMLQQTQADRVINLYSSFISLFPTVAALASSPFREVLNAWQGLGYNRRALMLHRLAKTLVEEKDAAVPNSPETLERLPGIGKATAASIAVFAFNRPAPFIETNVRTVFLHFFFHGKEKITDRALMPLVERAMPEKNPRLWFSALMDYGSMLKKRYPNPGRKSAHHRKQPKFEGSRRQLRGMILRLLLGLPGMSAAQIADTTGTPKAVLNKLLDMLKKEGLILKKKDGYYIY